jgi:predicted RNA-binding Zn ribbon-like protein
MKFAFVSGSVALDFVGTVQSRRDAPLDLLTTPDDLAEWAAASGVLAGPTRATRSDLTAAVHLREAVYRLVLASGDGSPFDPEDCEVLNRAARRVPVRCELRPDGTVVRHGTIGNVLSTLARDAVGLLVEPPGRVKECAAPRCTRLYVDRSHRGSRRWCDMMRCGNRAKAAVYRSRHA